MANTDCTYQKEGYVIIGVADNDKASSDWTAIYHETPLGHGAHRVVGIPIASTYTNNRGNIFIMEKVWRQLELHHLKRL